MKLFSIIIFFILLNTSSLANEMPHKRIYITYTLEKTYLESIYSTLKEIGVTIYVDDTNGDYLIYSKKYSLDDAKIEIDLKKIKTKFQTAKIITRIAKLEQEANFNINLSVGSSSIQSKHNYDFNNNYAVNYELELAYLLNKYTSFSIAYLNTSQSKIDIDNLYATLNHTFYPTQDFYLLFGLLAGYSKLEFNNHQDTKQSTSTLIGIKTKLGYNLTNNFDIFVQYNGINLEHIVFVKDTSQEIIFNFLHNVTIGLGVRF